MLGKINHDKKTCEIIGAGISGLIAGYYFKKNGFSVKIYEASNRVGGLIKTEENEFGMVQQGPHLTKLTPAFKKMCKDLKVKLIRPKSKKRFFLYGGKLVKNPLKFREKIWGYFRARYQKSKDDYRNSYHFFSYHFGVKWAKTIFSAMTRGIYAVSLERLNPKIAFPLFYPEKDKSVLKSMKKKKRSKKMVAPKDGFGDLVEKLAKYLSKEIHRNYPVERIRELTAGNKIITTPAYIAGGQLAGMDGDLASCLVKIKYASLSTTTIFLDKNSLRKKLRGIGFLNCEEENLLGVLYNSGGFQNRVKHKKTVSLTAMTKFELPWDDLRQSLNNLFLTDMMKLDYQREDYRFGIPIYDDNLAKLHENKFDWLEEKGNILFSNYSKSASISEMVEQMANQF